MKIKIPLVLSALLLCGNAFAATYVLPFGPANTFGASTTNANVSPSYAVVSARSGNGGAPVVTFLDVASDLAGSTVQFYKVQGALEMTLGTNGSALVYVQSTNNQQQVNWQSGTALIRHITDDSYEKRSLTSNTGATNLVFTVAPLGVCTNGDMVYFMTTTGAPKIAWGASTNTLGNGAPLIGGQKGLPLLVEVTLTSNGGLYSVGGYYAP